MDLGVLWQVEAYRRDGIETRTGKRGAMGATPDAAFVEPRLFGTVDEAAMFISQRMNTSPDRANGGYEQHPWRPGWDHVFSMRRIRVEVPSRACPLCGWKSTAQTEPRSFQHIDTSDVTGRLLVQALLLLCQTPRFKQGDEAAVFDEVDRLAAEAFTQAQAKGQN